MNQSEIIKYGEWQTDETLWGPITFRVVKNMPDYSNTPYFIKQLEDVKKHLSEIEGVIVDP